MIHYIRNEYYPGLYNILIYFLSRKFHSDSASAFKGRKEYPGKHFRINLMVIYSSYRTGKAERT
jgi:hypothetical protein